MGVTVRQKYNGRKKPWWVFMHYRRRIYSMRIGDKHAVATLASELRRKLRRGELTIQPMAPSEAPYLVDYARHFLETETGRG